MSYLVQPDLVGSGDSPNEAGSGKARSEFRAVPRDVFVMGVFEAAYSP